ncbi:MAG: roadblock/LC7 domain-containing protein [Acidobacteriota bacterium]
MFSERLETLIDSIDGAEVLSLVAKDGIPVESVSKDPSVDLELLAAELMSQVRAVTQNHQELAVGRVQHLSIATDNRTLMVSALTEDYYLLLVLANGGNSGRARFALRRAVLTFEDDLL